MKRTSPAGSLSTPVCPLATRRVTGNVDLLTPENRKVIASRIWQIQSSVFIDPEQPFTPIPTQSRSGRSSSAVPQHLNECPQHDALLIWSGDRHYRWNWEQILFSYQRTAPRGTSERSINIDWIGPLRSAAGTRMRLEVVCPRHRMWTFPHAAFDAIMDRREEVAPCLKNRH